MSKAGKLVKGLVKTKKESVMGKLGDSPFEDPMDQWSVKYNAPVQNEETEQLDEDGWLFKYIRSLGYNPQVMPFATRAKYARTTAFKHYKQSHSQDGSKTDGIVQKEEAEQIDEISVDTQTKYFKAAERSKSAAKGSAEYARRALHDPEKAAEHEKTVAKREKGISRYVKRYNERNPSPKVTATHSAPNKYPLGGYDPKSNRSYSESNDMCNVCGQTPCNCTHITEAGTGLLMQFIKMKGLNPLNMDGNQKHAYARSSEFKIFKMKHQKEEFDRLVELYGRDNLLDVVMHIQETSGMGERGDDWDEVTGNEVPKQIKEKKKIKEATDKEDVISLNIPLLIRILEYAREDAKTDMDLHKVVENLISMRDKGILSMDEYDAIVKIAEGFEASHTKVGGGTPPKGTYAYNRMYGKYTAKGELRKKYAGNPGKEGQVAAGGGTPADKGAMAAKNEEVEQIDELKSSTYDSYINKVTDPKVASTRGKTPTGTLKSIKAIGGTAKAIGMRAKAQKRELDELKKMPDNMDADDHITREMKDPCWKGYDMVGTKKKNGKTVPNCVPVQEGIGGIEDSPLSATNSVKAMESAHRKGQMKSARMIKSLYKNKIKETTYDWEKDDKPKAKIVVKGGTTMTGQPRDTVEIEPVLKSRPNSAKPSN